MTSNINYINHIKRESVKTDPSYLRLIKATKRIPEHYLVRVRSYYYDHIKFKYSTEYTPQQLGEEILRINKIFK